MLKVSTKSSGELSWSGFQGYSHQFCENGDLAVLKNEELVALVLENDILEVSEEDED